MFTSPVTVQDLAARLPEPEALRTTCRAFGVLDAAFKFDEFFDATVCIWREAADSA
jgi:hypothetical protein